MCLLLRTNPPEKEKCNTFKKFRSYIKDIEYEKIQKLVQNTELGDKKPSFLLFEVQQLLPENDYTE